LNLRLIGFPEVEESMASFSPSAVFAGPIRWIAALGLFLSSILVSLPGQAARLPNPGDSSGRVYLLRGQGWVFSGGWGTLRDRLRQTGVWADDVSDHAGNWVADDVLAEHKAGRLRGPIVFLGHSRGGRQALTAAERLGRAGLPVELILTVDVAIPPPVPANVRRAVNLYLTPPRLYPARPLKPAPGSPAAIENIALNALASPGVPHGLHHLNITGNPCLQDYLVRRIMAVMRTTDDLALTRWQSPP
jgi:hypothetical protein